MAATIHTCPHAVNQLLAYVSTSTIRCLSILPWFLGAADEDTIG